LPVPPRLPRFELPMTDSMSVRRVRTSASFYRTLILAALAALVPFLDAWPAAGAQDVGAAEEASWLRYPAISPDGRTLVFTYQGDLWRAPVEGGEPTRLTAHSAHDYRPVWSPDGEGIAFASDRHGNFNVFVMPARGGAARRLTSHSADETPFAFAPDGAHVIFGATRLDDYQNRQFPSGALPELYQVPVEGGRPIQLLTIPAEDVALSQDGRLLLYHDKKGGEDEWRKYHTSSVTRDIWAWDREEDTHRQLTTFEGEDRTPVLVPGASDFFYLSEASGSYNVYRMPLTGGSSTQVTHFEGAPVRFLSASDDGTLAFGHDGLLYTLAPGASEPRQVAIRIASDWKANDERVIPVAGNLSELAVSPSGKEIAFTFRGEVFVASVEAGTTKRITDTAEREVGVVFSDDGKALLYASERDGRWGIWEARRSRESEPHFFTSTLIEERPVVVNGRQNFQPVPSPDGDRLAFIEDYHTLRVLDRESGEVVTLLTEDHLFGTGPGMQFEWSPDGKWILFTYSVPGRAPRDIGVVRTDGSGEVRNLTLSGFMDSSPQWILGGRGMIWRSNREGLRSYQATGRTEADVYAMFFTQDAWDEFQLSEEERNLLRERREEAEENDEVDEDEPVVPDFEWARNRRTRLTIHSSGLGDFLVSKDGETLYYLTRFERGLDLWSTNLLDRETRQVLSLNANSASITWDEDQEKIFLLADGNAAVVDPSRWNRESIPVRGEMMVSGRAERAAMFDQAWRRVQDTFYTRSFHGADWDAVRGMYEKFLPHIGNNHEFTELLSEMLGELDVSHSGARYSSSDPSDDATAALGIFYDQSRATDGLVVTEVIRGGPLDRAGMDIEPGAVIEAIDGESLTQDVDPARLLNRKADRNVLIHVRDPNGGTREVVTKPITLGEENRLRYERWVERNRKEVEELSGGRLGYVHVQGMNDRAFRSTYEEVMGRYADAEGLVVDTRFNPGGDLVADLEMFFSGRRFFDYTTDDRSSGFEPSFRWTRPTVTLVSEGNYSDGHCFAWAYQAMGIGPLIGMPVPGTCTFGGGLMMLDGIRIGVPARGVKDVETGRFFENWQTEPDIMVRNTPGQVDRGRDQQLERAVEELLGLVER